ncbi:MAG: hypothetical protein HY362_04340 [Candidatus Aenigmarchaeota archaeon]|nr:hypothetical protein [Candidatus Aenigmarchaeota archaeon]
MVVTVTLDGRTASEILHEKRVAAVRVLVEEHPAIDPDAFNKYLDIRHPINGYVAMLPTNGEGRIVGGGAAVLAKVADDTNRAVADYIAQMGKGNAYGATTPAYGAKPLPTTGGRVFDRRRAGLPPGVDLVLKEAVKP